MEAESNDIWDYFDKLAAAEIGDRRAKCRLCEKIYNFTTTIHNLKMHLQRKHSISFVTPPSVQKPPPKERRKRNTEIWNFFSRVEGKEKFASCHYCDKVLSYQTTTNNLKTHLRKQHPDAFSRLEQSLPAEIAYVAEYLESDDEENDSCDGAKQQASELWGYFETESGTSSVCAVCCASVPSRPADLRHHLLAKHPKLLGDYLSQDSDQNDDVYSEVIYLEENPKTKEQKIKVKKIDLDGYKRARKRRHSQEQPKKSVEDEEIETFGSYITCLMKQLPRDVCTTVQRDIIDIIMNAKTRDRIKVETQQSLIKEIMKEMNCDNSNKKDSDHSFDEKVVEDMVNHTSSDGPELDSSGEKPKDQKSTDDKEDDEE